MVQFFLRAIGLIALLAASAGATTLIPAPSVPISAGWQARDAGSFQILAPDETVLHRRGAFAGGLSDRRFTLTYAIGRRVDADLGREGQDHQLHAIDVGGRPAVLHTAEFPGEAEPYFLQLVVPEAVRAPDGHWLAFEIHGWFANSDRRWLGEHVVKTVDFTPPFDRPLKPPRPHVDPPMIVQEFP